ncbi:unnamed protein product [Rhizophagus irregularis]|nr:unnamed protein product [Rhizophagus irregularis]
MIIIEYNQIQYILHHRTIFDAIKELLSNKEIFKYCIFDYNSDYIMNDKGEQKHCYSELYNNATTCNTLRKKTEYSVFLILGNIPSWRRNKPDAKALLAYLHKINDHQKKHVMAKYQLFQCLMNILVIKSIMSVMSDVKLLAENKKAIIEMSDGLDLRTDDVAMSYVLMCMIPKNELNNPLINYSTIQLRTPNIIKGILTDELSKDYSIHKIENPF